VAPLTVAVAGVLACWFLMTVIVQLPFSRCRRLRRYDPAGHLLPGWNFFAPKPVQADFAVWYRSWASCANDLGEVPGDGSSAWLELAGISERRVTDAAVNPGRYARKTIFTCCERIAVMLRDERCRPDDAADLPADAILMSLPYLLLLTKVSALCATAVAVQFRIDVIRHQRGTPLARTVFRSAVHRAAPAHAGQEGGRHVAAS